MTQFARFYDSARLPLWQRVVWFALDHHGQALDRAQLLDAVDPQRLTRSAEVSRAIRQAIRKGMLEPGSSASMLRFAHDDVIDEEQDAA